MLSPVCSLFSGNFWAFISSVFIAGLLSFFIGTPHKFLRYISEFMPDSCAFLPPVLGIFPLNGEIVNDDRHYDQDANANSDRSDGEQPVLL